jgi:tRNA modification GTPase
VIESLGVERTRRAIADADLVVLVIDGSQPLMGEDRDIFEDVEKNSHLIVLNKSDLETFSRGQLGWRSDRTTSIIDLSAKTGAGLDALRDAILKPFSTGDMSNAGLLVTDARHFDLLKRTQSALSSSVNLLSQRVSEEIVLVGLYDALRFLGEITGETTPDDVLSQIFATFCIGK